MQLGAGSKQQAEVPEGDGRVTLEKGVCTLKVFQNKFKLK